MDSLFEESDNELVDIECKTCMVQMYHSTNVHIAMGDRKENICTLEQSLSYELDQKTHAFLLLTESTKISGQVLKILIWNCNMLHKF